MLRGGVWVVKADAGALGRRRVSRATRSRRRTRDRWVRGPSVSRACRQAPVARSATVWMAKARRLKQTSRLARCCWPWPKLCSRVAAVLEHVEALVLDLPARPCAGGELGHGLARDRQIGDEAVAVGELALRVADLDRQPVDRERLLVGPQRDVAEPAVGMGRVGAPAPEALDVLVEFDAGEILLDGLMG